jgi:hypothetical protein
MEVVVLRFGVMDSEPGTQLQRLGRRYCKLQRLGRRYYEILQLFSELSYKLGGNIINQGVLFCTTMFA